MEVIEDKKREKLWTAHLIKVMLVGFVLQLCNQIHITTLPLFAQEIGGNKAVAGLIMGVFTTSALIFRPLAGKLCDKIGRKYVLIAGISIFVAMSLSYRFIGVVWMLLFFRFIHGIGFSAQSTSVGTIVSDVLPRSRLVEGIGYHGVVMTLGTAIGPALGLYLIVHSSYENLYTLIFFLSVLALFLATFINYEQVRTQEAKPIAPPSEKSKIRLYTQKDFFRTSAIMFFCAMALASITIFLPTYAFSLGIEDVGIFFTVYAFVLMIARPLTGKLTNRFGVSKVIIPGIICLLGSFTAMIWASNLSVFLIIAIFIGLGYGIVQPILNALTIKFSSHNNRGVANAVFFASLDAGYGTGSILWGIISEYAGFGAIYFTSAVCIVTALILYFILLPKDYSVMPS